MRSPYNFFGKKCLPKISTFPHSRVTIFALNFRRNLFAFQLLERLFQSCRLLLLKFYFTKGNFLRKIKGKNNEIYIAINIF